MALEQITVGLGDHPHAVGRLNANAVFQMAAHHFVRQELAAENCECQHFSIETVLADVVLLFQAAGHVTAGGIKHAPIPAHGFFHVVVGGPQTKLLRCQQCSAMETLVG